MRVTIAVAYLVSSHCRAVQSIRKETTTTRTLFHHTNSNNGDPESESSRSHIYNRTQHVDSTRSHAESNRMPGNDRNEYQAIDTPDNVTNESHHHHRYPKVASIVSCDDNETSFELDLKLKRPTTSIAKSKLGLEWELLRERRWSIVHQESSIVVVEGRFERSMGDVNADDMNIMMYQFRECLTLSACGTYEFILHETDQDKSDSAGSEPRMNQEIMNAFVMNIHMQLRLNHEAIYTYSNSFRSRDRQDAHQQHQINPLLPLTSKYTREKIKFQNNEERCSTNQPINADADAYYLRPARTRTRTRTLHKHGRSIAVEPADLDAETTVSSFLNQIGDEGEKKIMQRVEDVFGDEYSDADFETTSSSSSATGSTDNNGRGSVIASSILATKSESAEKEFNENQSSLSATEILLLSAVGVFIVIMLIFNESSSITSTWDVSRRKKVISHELPGSIPVFIPMYNESEVVVERTCNNFTKETIDNPFLRDELMVYFIVDNMRDCEAVKTVLKIAEETVEEAVENLPTQLDVPYYTGRLHGVPFKMYLKSESESESNRVKQGKRFSALLFADLVKDDVMNGYLKMPWSTLCLDADVVTFPYSIESLVVQMLQKPNIGVTCGNLAPSLEQKSIASRVQAAEYFIHNRITKHAEALFGVVSHCPGAFLLMKFDSFRTTVTAAFSIDTKNSSCVVRNALDLGEDRFLTSLLLIHKSKWTSFLPAANCTTQVPDTFQALAIQRRRWFNSTLSNDLYILRHIVHMYKSAMKHGEDKNTLVAVVRFIYLVVATLVRLVGSFFSIMVSVLIMASISFMMDAERWCYGNFCGYTYHSFVLIITCWVMALALSFHQSAGNPRSMFNIYSRAWMNINLAFASFLMTLGTISIILTGDMAQGRLIALTTFILTVIYLSLIINMAEHRSTFGLQLMISLPVYVAIGLPFLAFMQPIIGLSQADNFEWGIDDDNGKNKCDNNFEATSKADQIGPRRREKLVLLLFVIALNAAVFLIFGSIGARSTVTTICYVFLFIQCVQTLFGVVRNINLKCQSKIPVEKHNDASSSKQLKKSGRALHLQNDIERQTETTSSHTHTGKELSIFIEKEVLEDSFTDSDLSVLTEDDSFCIYEDSQ